MRRTFNYRFRNNNKLYYNVINRVRDNNIYPNYHKSKKVIMEEIEVKESNEIYIDSSDNMFYEFNHQFTETEIPISNIINNKKIKERKFFIKNNTLDSDNRVNRVQFLGKYEYESSFYIFNGPTLNCQLSSIGNAENILSSKIEYREKIIDFIRDISRNMLLFDIRYKVLEEIKDIFKNNLTFINENKYESTNGTIMVLILTKWNEKKC